jgi:alginate O-acetyltransferase complex protein AlgI
VLFNTYEFLFFFACVLGAFCLLPSRHRWVLLLIASYVFYAGWRPSFVVFLMFSTLLDYASARIIEAGRSDSARKAVLFGTIGINLGILFTFKYLDFAITNIAGLAGFFGVELPDYVVKLVLPLGISFYTFQSMSYVIDVYSRRVRAETHFGIYALYVAFFPQLVAGPIGRAPALLHQFKKPKSPTPDDVTSGLWLAGYGLFKKMCIADAIAPVVNGIFSQPDQYNGTYLLIASVLFGIQIYCDFSGYSDIAIGIARIMGYRLSINFRQPYFATSLSEFWRCWHISLSSWFRDYLYLPLGGNRVPLPRWVFNILVVFVVSGLWHGAAWTFVAWGLLHGVGLVIEHLAGRRLHGHSPATDRTAPPHAVHPIVGWMLTQAVVFAGWVFFRANSIGQAFEIFGRLPALGPIEYGTFKVLGLPSFELAMTVLNIAILLFIDRRIASGAFDERRSPGGSALRTILGVALVYYIVLFGVFQRIEFIYFQF